MNYFAVTFYEAISQVSVIATFIAGLVALVLGFLSARQKVTIVTLNESNDAYKELLNTADLLHKKDIALLEAKDNENKALQQKCEVLENQVTQAPEIHKLAIQLATQHKQTLIEMSKMTKNLGELGQAFYVAILKDKKGKKSK